jgi:hypothetical protein
VRVALALVARDFVAPREVARFADAFLLVAARFARGFDPVV